MISSRKEAGIARAFARVLRQLKPDIADDYRAFDMTAEEARDSLPSMQVTIGISADGSWSWQSGDNSYTGGAYGHAFWGVVALYRRSNTLELARQAVSEALDQMADEA